MKNKETIQEIMKDSPIQKIGLDDFYGRQTVINMLEEAINYNRCSIQLKTENKKLSYDEWKEKLNVQKVEETIYKKGEHFMTINDILEMYNEYCSSF